MFPGAASQEVKEQLYLFPQLVLVGFKCFSMLGQEGAHSQIMRRPVPAVHSLNIYVLHRTWVFCMYDVVKLTDKTNAYLSVNSFPFPSIQIAKKHMVAIYLQVSCKERFLSLGVAAVTLISCCTKMFLFLCLPFYGSSRWSGKRKLFSTSLLAKFLLSY